MNLALSLSYTFVVLMTTCSFGLGCQDMLVTDIDIAGSTLRIEVLPEYVIEFTTDEINITCTPQDLPLGTKEIMLMELGRNGERPIVTSKGSTIELGTDMKNNMEAKGQIGKNVSESFLRLTIKRPFIVKGINMYCRMFYQNEIGELKMGHVYADMSIDKPDTTLIVKDLARTFSTILTKVQEQSTQFDKFTKENDEQNTQIDKLTKQIDEQNTQIDKQSKQNDEQNTQIDKQSKQNDEQNTQIDKLAKQIENQAIQINKQNTYIYKQSEFIRKQNVQLHQSNKNNTKHQLDALINYIKQQYETVQKHEIQLNNMAQKLFPMSTTPASATTIAATTITSPTTIYTSRTTECLDGWTFYKGDKTCLRVFNRYLSWSKAREMCQSLHGDLVQIRDEDKNFFVYKMFDGIPRHPWIGIRNHATHGFDFKYVDGSYLGKYHPWWPGWPKGDVNNDVKCVLMSKNPNHPGEWWDENCSHEASYVCSVQPLGVL